MKIQEEHLVSFYTNYFPYEALFKWLTNGDESSFKKRELSFTIENDKYMRYRSYDGADEFKQDMLLVKPHKIDLGAIFTVPVCKLQTTAKLKHVTQMQQWTLSTNYQYLFVDIFSLHNTRKFNLTSLCQSPRNMSSISISLITIMCDFVAVKMQSSVTNVGLSWVVV